MRLAVLAVMVMACGHSPAGDTPVARPGAPRLAPPMPIDPARPGAAYLNGVAMLLQPGWGQFLDDCRLRLPAGHALNNSTLAATEELVIDRAGVLVDATLAHSSGSSDFDRAAREVIQDSPMYGPPPIELLSDDDRVHVRWLFARDRRQAGPATSEVVRVELPIVPTIVRLVNDGDLARAAQRIARAQPSPERDEATRLVMIAALREAMSGDRAARRAAVDAVAIAQVHELAAMVRGLLDDPNDVDVVLGAVTAAAALGDELAADPLLLALDRELARPTRPELSRAALRALQRLDRRGRASELVARHLDIPSPSPLAIEAYALAPVPEADARLERWFARGDVHTRAAVCVALSAMAPARGVPLVQRGLGDRDATVRARCIDSVAVIAHDARKLAGKLSPAIRDLERDRDREVRAAAIMAAAAIDPVHVVDASSDSAAEVRVAYVHAIAGQPDKLRALADDPDVDVRAAAWAALAKVDPAPDPASVARAVADLAPQVRIGAIAVFDDETALEHLAAGDDSPDVRTAALVRLAHRRGRLRATEHLLERLATASPHSADRARVALAWLLAP